MKPEYIVLVYANFTLAQIAKETTQDTPTSSKNTIPAGMIRDLQDALYSMGLQLEGKSTATGKTRNSQGSGNSSSKDQKSDKIRYYPGCGADQEKDNAKFCYDCGDI